MPNIHTYTADSDNKVRNVKCKYVSGTHLLHVSNNAVVVNLLSTLDDPQLALCYQSVSFGSNVLSVDAGCCKGFANMTSLAFNSNGNLQWIGSQAFYGDASIGGRVDFPATLTAIDEEAFYGCSSLKFAGFASTPVQVGARAFYGAGLESIALTSTTTGEAAFSKSALTIVDFTGQIAAREFEDCDKLAKFSLNNSTSIPDYAFSGCTALATFLVGDPQNITYIGSNAFSRCPNLTIDFSGFGLTSIGSGVLWGNTKTTSLTLPATITAIEQLDSQWLAGSNVQLVTFLGMSSAYMSANTGRFTTFGTSQSIRMKSSDGVVYVMNENGIGIRLNQYRTYIISIAESNNVKDKPLIGEYVANIKYKRMIDAVYAGKTNNIVGYVQLGDGDEPATNPYSPEYPVYELATKARVNSAFQDAKAKNADFIIFMFADHGGSNGHMSLYQSSYKYVDLINQLKNFKAAFVLLDCCYAWSKTDDIQIENVKLMVWGAATRKQKSYSNKNYSGAFTQQLSKNFNKDFTWNQFFEKAYKKKHIKASDGDDAYLDPQCYIYNDFDVNQQVFTYKGS